jgi:hypothetical protein
VTRKPRIVFDTHRGRALKSRVTDRLDMDFVQDLALAHEEARNVLLSRIEPRTRLRIQKILDRWDRNRDERAD